MLSRSFVCSNGRQEQQKYKMSSDMRSVPLADPICWDLMQSFNAIGLTACFTLLVFCFGLNIRCKALWFCQFYVLILTVYATTCDTDIVLFLLRNYIIVIVEDKFSLLTVKFKDWLHKCCSVSSVVVCISIIISSSCCTSLSCSCSSVSCSISLVTTFCVLAETVSWFTLLPVFAKFYRVVLVCL